MANPTVRPFDVPVQTWENMTPRMQDALGDPACRYSLRNAVILFATLDPVDALADAEALAEMCRERLDAVTGMPRIERAGDIGSFEAGRAFSATEIVFIMHGRGAGRLTTLGEIAREYFWGEGTRSEAIGALTTRGSYVTPTGDVVRLPSHVAPPKAAQPEPKHRTAFTPAMKRALNDPRAAACATRFPHAHDSEQDAPTPEALRGMAALLDAEPTTEHEAGPQLAAALRTIAHRSSDSGFTAQAFRLMAYQTAAAALALVDGPQPAKAAPTVTPVIALAAEMMALAKKIVAASIDGR